MSGGYDLREFLSGLMEHFRNLLVARVIGTPDLIETSDVYRTRYAETAGRFSVSDLLRAQRLVHGTDQALRYTAQPRFRLEADLVQLVTMPRAVDLAGLIDGIEELKKKGIAERSNLPPAPASPALPQHHPSSTASRVVPPAASPQPLPAAWARRNVPPAPAEAAAKADMPASPAGKGPNEDEVRSRWAEYVAEVSHQKISVGAVLGATAFLGVVRGAIRVGCVDEFQASTVQRNREVLMDIFARVFGVRAPLQAEVQSASGEETPEKQQAPPDEHPVVKALRRELGAEPL